MTTTYHHENIVLGESVEALLFAWFEDYSVVLPNIKEPDFFEFISCDTNLLSLGFDQKSRLLKSNTKSKIKTHQINKLQLYHHLIFTLSIKGRLICHPYIKRVSKQSDKNVLKIVTNLERFTLVEFQNLWIFDDVRIKGIQYDVHKKQKQQSYVLDYMKIADKQQPKHKYDIMVFDKFPDTVWFDNTREKCVAKSYLTNTERNNLEYDVSMIARGLRKILNTQYSPVFRRFVPSTVVQHKSYDNINFCYDSLDGILSKETEPKPILL